MLALDPDNAPDEAESSEDDKELEPGGPPEWYLNDFEPLEPDVAEVASLGVQPTPVEAGELMSNSRAPPAWKRDDFPPKGPVRRSVWTPPYGLRPPDKEPEDWLSLNQNSRDAFRAQWKLRDPIGFGTQEARRKSYVEMKRAERSPKPP